MCIRDRARTLHEAAQAGDHVEPNLAAASLRVVASSGDGSDYDAIVEGYRSAATPQAEMRYLGALLRFDDADLFERTLQLLTDEVRTQNAPFLLAAAMGHLDHGPRAWELVTRRWDELNQRFPANSIPRMLGGVRSLSTPELAADVAAFLAEHPVPQGALTVAQHLEKLTVNVELRAREGKSFA